MSGDLALLALGDLELDGDSRLQRSGLWLAGLADDVGEMDEEIGAALGMRDETVAAIDHPFLDSRNHNPERVSRVALRVVDFTTSIGPPRCALGGSSGSVGSSMVSLQA